MLIVKKFILSIFILSLILGLPINASAEDTPYVSADCAVIMHSGGQFVYEKNADAKALIASTTKIMTAIVVIENCGLDEMVEIRPEWCGLEGSSMYLEAGQRCTVKELLSGLLLVSGNDAAVALACHTAGDEDGFAKLMNKRAKELGMCGSRFANPHGLNAENHFSTARDMAVLMDYCMQNSDFAEISGMKVCNVGEQTLINHNKLLSLCQGCVGGKTGYTEAAGRCLVSCCERNGTRFICVTLSAPDDWNDHQKLYNWCFSKYADREVTEGLSFDVPVVSGTKNSVSIVPEKLILFLPKAAELTITAEMPYFVFAPVKEGENAGRAVITLNGEKIAETSLVFSESISPAVRINNFKENTLEPL